MQGPAALRVWLVLPGPVAARRLASSVPVLCRQAGPSVPSFQRRYATHRETGGAPPPPEIPNLGRQASGKHEFAESFSRVGPFEMGTGGTKGWKKWGELSGGGKRGSGPPEPIRGGADDGAVKRAGGQLGSMAVVLAGLTLLGAVGYALGSEVLGHDNPRRLYSDAIDLVGATHCASLRCHLRRQHAYRVQLDGHLLPPIKFTHSPTITSPSRGTPPIVHQEIINPTSGRKHMLVKFWVHGRGKDEAEWFGSVKDFFRNVRAQAAQYATEYGLEWAGSRTMDDDRMEVDEEMEAAQAPAPSWTEWLGLSSLTGLKTTEKERERRRTIISRKPPPAGTYKMGEVTADWVKVRLGLETYPVSVH